MKILLDLTMRGGRGALLRCYKNTEKKARNVSWNGVY